MKSMQVISDLFDSLRNPDFIKNVCRGMSYMAATLFTHFFLKCILCVCMPEIFFFNLS